MLVSAIKSIDLSVCFSLIGTNSWQIGCFIVLIHNSNVSEYCCSYTRIPSNLVQSFMKVKLTQSSSTLDSFTTILLQIKHMNSSSARNSILGIYRWIQLALINFGCWWQQSAVMNNFQQKELSHKCSVSALWDILLLQLLLSAKNLTSGELRPGTLCISVWPPKILHMNPMQRMI